MRIVAGAWRGRSLIAPPGQGTRPTADRVRQALFDMLMHAKWAGREAMEDAAVLDVFAGTGALGLEALSRGAASVSFVENDPAALKALRSNIVACKAEGRTTVVAADVLTIPFMAWPAQAGLPRPAVPDASRPHPVMTQHGDMSNRVSGGPASLVFLDPPYGQNLVPRALFCLRDAGRIRSDALIIAETGRDETWVPDHPVLAERQNGAARILVFRTA